ncbi:MAG: response regulator transcription factor [Chitinophagaceae bacterium]
MIKVYIVEDHSVVVEGVRSLLQNEKEFEVIGYTDTGEGCLDFFRTRTADVILMDISLPDMNGIDLCKIIKENYPGIMVLALSTFNQGIYVSKMMESGASGYLLKNSGRLEIIQALKDVAAGKTYLSFEAGQALKSNNAKRSEQPLLTKREKEILGLITEGLTNAQIAEKLFISIDTVDSHRKNLYSKLNVKNIASLMRYAIENNLMG